MSDPTPRDGAWHEVSRDAITHNYQLIRQLLPKNAEVLCSLKSNGYGLGAEPVARILQACGVTSFAVGSVRDAQVIRLVLPDARILLYGGVLAANASIVAEGQFTVTLSNEQDIVQWHAVSCRPHECFLKIDVGLDRFGFTLEDLDCLSQYSTQLRELNITGVYTHMTGDDPEMPDWATQRTRFESALAVSERHLPHLRVRCAASSDQVLRSAHYDYNCVDVGGALFGIRDQGPRSHQPLRHALAAIKSRVTSIKTVGSDSYLPGQVERIGIVRFGWGDGYPRHHTGDAFALVNGKQTPIVGPIHLEHMRVDLTGRDDVSVGDEVAFLGTQGAEEITPENLTIQWGLDGIDHLYGNLRSHLPTIVI